MMYASNIPVFLLLLFPINRIYSSFNQYRFFNDKFKNTIKELAETDWNGKDLFDVADETLMVKYTTKDLREYVLNIQMKPINKQKGPLDENKNVLEWLRKYSKSAKSLRNALNGNITIIQRNIRRRLRVLKTTWLDKLEVRYHYVRRQFFSILTTYPNAKVFDICFANSESQLEKQLNLTKEVDFGGCTAKSKLQVTKILEMIKEKAMVKQTAIKDFKGCPEDWEHWCYKKLLVDIKKCGRALRTTKNRFLEKIKIFAEDFLTAIGYCYEECVQNFLLTTIVNLRKDSICAKRRSRRKETYYA